MGDPFYDPFYNRLSSLVGQIAPVLVLAAKGSMVIAL